MRLFIHLGGKIKGVSFIHQLYNTRRRFVMGFWIVEKRDDAIMGFVCGVQAQDTMAGPFSTYEDALLVKQAEYPRGGAYYYTIIESDSRPDSSRKTYEFVDADTEFYDV